MTSLLRVRYADTDQMGVAYHSNYLIWFEVARTDFCRSCGFTYARMESQVQCYLPVTEVRCRYRRPLKYDEEFRVEASIEQISRRGMKFKYRVVSPDGSILYAEGNTHHIVTDGSGRPKKLPDAFYRRFKEIQSNEKSG